MFDALFSGRIGEILAPLADPVDVFFRALETGDRDKMAEALASDAVGHLLRRLLLRRIT